MAEGILTADRLRETLHYDPETGVFTRKVRLAQRHQVGDRADFVVKGGGLAGYYRVGLFSKRYLAHRLAWLYVHGEWPKHDIDHINGNPGDNRIANLRDVPNEINRQNMRAACKGNSSGYLGVYWNKENRNWVARIQVNRKGIHIGCFSDPYIAHLAYLKFKRQMHSDGCTI
jgi:hypothetical protein